MELAATGALAGWKRSPAANGILLTVQIAQTTESFQNREFATVHMALNDRQLRSLARDLARAAEERGIDLWAKRPWWKRW